ncbi:TonB C-terminal domain-containing protein [Helicobacter sp. MIT 14-3879]|uniref:TonB C-terminal domain-containing protein n=1 Tax=Helicobacter sp. MIT 14-3879 TaxID=2040649 RepID=UPI000E1EB0DD|nr:TonB C-terminal domain-containing protein [Helicobacter sp. MIT 14-3879]RDU63170.1 hypothetical protein CQA44_05905 [Helicobacter sp. MIT 14-3879]
MDKSKQVDIVFMLSGIFAIFLYVLLLLIMMFVFKAGINHISISINNPSTINSINIDIIEEVDSVKQAQKNKQILNKVKINDSDAKNKDNGSNTPIPGLGMGELFNKISDIVPSKDLEQSDNRNKIVLNKKGSTNTEEHIDKIIEKTENIMQTLENLNQDIVISDSINSKFCEKYNDYCKEVTELLYKNWNIKSSFNDRLSSIVSIKINKDGNFSYTIKKKSGNEIFDKELEDSLQKLINNKFPTLNDVDSNLEVIFMNKGA